ncbi:MAG: zinc ribbon domain-containing protein [Pseudonocardiales bacterium]
MPGEVGGVQLRYNFRLYPTPGQRQSLAKAFGCARVVFNGGLAARREAHAYKAARAGRTFAKIDRWFPSSQLCSACGAIDGHKPLTVRSWTCACGAVHDRDANAALNILAAGRADKSNACGAQVRPEILAAPRVEAGTHRRPLTGAVGISGLQAGEDVKSAAGKCRSGCPGG